MSKLVQDPPRPPVVGTITQFLTTLPSPLTISLVSLSPHIGFVRWLLETLSWKGSWDESWLLLAAWWGVCLGAESVLRCAFCTFTSRLQLKFHDLLCVDSHRYLLPPLIVLVWWLLQRRAAIQAARPQPATEDTLHQTIADLTTIQELFPSSSHLMSCSHLGSVDLQDHEQAARTITLPPLHTVLRVFAVAYPPYLLVTLTSFIRLRTLIALAGTAVILHRAPFAVVIRRSLWRSAYFRWGVYWTWAKISGTPLPSGVSTPVSDISILAMTGAASKEASSPHADNAGSEAKKSGSSIRFLFTVYENQRWWMGLDFTAALLPTERPSWCSKSLQPCSPPAAFSLPPPTTVYLPDPSVRPAPQPTKDSKGKSQPGLKRFMKRTAAWSWEEPEWKVVVRKEGSSGNTRVERPLPSLVEEGASASAGRILRAAGKIRGASVDLSPERKLKDADVGRDGGKDGGSGFRDGEKGAERATEDGQPSGRTQCDEEEEPFTDQDGWVYGDNKWEGGSAKGGMGKVCIYEPSQHAQPD